MLRPLGENVQNQGMPNAVPPSQTSGSQEWTRANALTPDVIRSIESAFATNDDVPQALRLIRQYLLGAAMQTIALMPPSEDRTVILNGIRDNWILSMTLMSRQLQHA